MNPRPIGDGKVGHSQRLHQSRELLRRLRPSYALADDHRRPFGVQQQVRGSRDLVRVALRRGVGIVVFRPVHRVLIHHLLEHVGWKIEIYRSRPSRLGPSECHGHVLGDTGRAVHLHRHLRDLSEHRYIVRLLESARVPSRLRTGAADYHQRHTVVERDMGPGHTVGDARPCGKHRHADLVPHISVRCRRECRCLLMPDANRPHAVLRPIPHHLDDWAARESEQG